MDPTATLTQAILSNPVVGAAGMVIAVVLLQVFRNWLPVFAGPSGASGSAKPSEPDTGRQLQATLHDAGEHIEQIADTLRTRNELARREVETLERVERLLVELLAAQRASQRSQPAPRVRPNGA